MTGRPAGARVAGGVSRWKPAIVREDAARRAAREVEGRCRGAGATQKRQQDAQPEQQRRKSVGVARVRASNGGHRMVTTQKYAGQAIGRAEASRPGWDAKGALGKRDR